MPTTSTIATARAALVSALDTGELSGNVYYAWPGPEASRDEHELLWIDNIPVWTQAIPNIKAGRKHRQERYVFELVLLVAKPELSSDGAQACFERAVELKGVVDDALADDVQLGQSDIQWLQLNELEPDLIPNGQGWLAQILIRIEGNARLT